jgi:hypothetical protein
MTIIRRLEKLEDAILRQGGDDGYKLVVTSEEETRQEAIERAGLTNWPSDRILLISFVKADLKLPPIR